MDPISLLAIGGALALGVPLALWVRRRFEARLEEAWRRAMKRQGMVIEGASSRYFGRRSLVARRHGLTVRFEVQARGKIRGTTITVSGLGHGEQALTVKAEGVASWIGKRLGQEEVELGAAADEDLLIHGDETLAQAVLDFETRKKLAKFLGDRSGNQVPSFEQGVLQVWVEQSRFWNAAKLDDAVMDSLDPLLDLAERLTRPHDLAARLAERLVRGPLREPEAGVRLQCLRLLLREFPGHPATAGAARTSLGDSNREVRLTAALVLGAEGRATLRALVADAAAPDAVAARAFGALSGELPFESVAATLDQALTAKRSELAKSCLEAVSRLDPVRAEGLLLGALPRQGEGIALTATGLLGRVGTVAAVPVLRALEERGDRELTRAARQAVAEIQSRLTGAEQGQLSLAGAEVGALSLVTEDEPGRLSLAEDEPGRLSLADPARESETAG